MSSLEENNGRWSRTLENIGRGLIKLINPLNFTALFAPSVIFYSAKAIKGEVATLGKTVVGDGVWSIFMENNAAPGMFDYCIQYFTVILVTVFWTHVWLTTIVIPFERVKAASKRGGRAGLLRLIFYLGTGILLAYWAVKTLLIGGAANFEVLNTYVRHTQVWGQYSSPPSDSPLTWLRFLIWGHGVLMTIWPAGKGIRS